MNDKNPSIHETDISLNTNSSKEVGKLEENSSSIDIGTLADLPPAFKYHVLSYLKPEVRKKAMSAASHEKLPFVRFVENIKSGDEKKLSLFTIKDLTELDEVGYFYKDGFLGKTGDIDIKELRNEVEALFTHGNLRAAKMNRGEEKWGDKSIRGDHLMWLNDREAIREHSSLLFSIVENVERLQKELNEVCQFNSKKTQIQLACYPGGGTRYIRHLDAFVGGPDRRITVLYYINPEWSSSDGGELRLYLGDEKEIDIEPIADRLVVFQSRQLEHEVLSSSAKRFAVTTWFY